MFVIVKNGKVVARIETATILFIEKNGRKLKVVTEAFEYSYYEKMSNIENILDDTFFQCRKGCYINLSKVLLMEENCILFQNGAEYWLGRDNFIKAKKAFYNYLTTKNNRS